MKRTTLDLLVCPTCHDKLLLRNSGNTPVIESGALLCQTCRLEYPIQKGIPHFIQLESLRPQNQRFAKFYNWFSYLYAPGARLTYNLFGEKGRRAILHYLDPLQGHVLETSIGTGPNLPYFISAPQVTEIHGLDISIGQLNQCQRYVQKKGWDVELTLGNAEDLPYQDNYFDVVFHFGGINFFDNIQKAIFEMVRVAKSGAKVVISDEGEKIARAYELTLPTFKKLFTGPRQRVCAPLELIPQDMEDLHLHWILHNQIYVIEFRKPNG